MITSNKLNLKIKKTNIYKNVNRIRYKRYRKLNNYDPKNNNKSCWRAIIWLYNIVFFFRVLIFYLFFNLRFPTMIKFIND